MRKFPGRINKLKEVIGAAVSGAFGAWGAEGKNPAELARKRKLLFGTGVGEYYAGDVNDKIYRTAAGSAGQFLRGNKAGRLALARKGMGRGGQTLPAEDIRKQLGASESLRIVGRAKFREAGFLGAVSSAARGASSWLEKKALKARNALKGVEQASVKAAGTGAEEVAGAGAKAGGVERAAAAEKEKKAAETAVVDKKKKAAEAPSAGQQGGKYKNADQENYAAALASERRAKGYSENITDAKGNITGTKEIKGDKTHTVSDEHTKLLATQRASNEQRQALRRSGREAVTSAKDMLPEGTIRDTATDAMKSSIKKKAGGGHTFDTQVTDATSKGLQSVGLNKTADVLQKGGDAAATGISQGLADTPENMALKQKRIERMQNRKQKNTWEKTPVSKMAVGATMASYGLDTMKTMADSANSDNYRNAQAGITMSAPGRKGNLRESRTWETRKRLYGPPGRKTKTWRYDPSNKSHLKHTKNMTDEQFRKYVHSTADLRHREGVKTVEGKPINHTYFSNNRKHTYASKTIGMRQKTLANHSRYNKPLPKGYEDFPYHMVNGKFKKMQRWGFEKRMYNKAPLMTKIKIKGQDLLSKIKNLIKSGKFATSESSAAEVANIQESSESFNVVQEAAKEPEAVTGCKFMEGQVSTPKNCSCDDCLSVCRKIVEAEKEFKETSETSFGQMLRGDEKPGHEEKETKEDEKKEKHHHKKNKGSFIHKVMTAKGGRATNSIIRLLNILKQNRR